MNTPPQPPHSPYTPPADPGYYIPGAVPQPSWPKVMGIIGIIVSAWGILGSLVGLLVGTAMNAISKAAPASAKMEIAEMSALMEKIKSFTMIQSIGIIILGAILLAGSIKLLRRQRASRGLMLAWAGGRILFALAMIPLMKDYMQVMMDSVLKTAPAGSTSSAQVAEIASMTGNVGVIGGALAGCALPVFAFIWFNLQKVKEHIATWQR